MVAWLLLIPKAWNLTLLWCVVKAPGLVLYSCPPQFYLLKSKPLRCNHKSPILFLQVSIVVSSVICCPIHFGQLLNLYSLHFFRDKINVLLS